MTKEELVAYEFTKRPEKDQKPTAKIKKQDGTIFDAETMQDHLGMKYKVPTRHDDGTETLTWCFKDELREMNLELIEDK